MDKEPLYLHTQQAECKKGGGLAICTAVCRGRSDQYLSLSLSLSLLPFLGLSLSLSFHLSFTCIDLAVTPKGHFKL